MAALKIKPDDDLLSHGETPHYHRRCSVSLLSSRWDQVVPDRYGRQETRFQGWLEVYSALFIFLWQISRLKYESALTLIPYGKN